MKRIITPLIHLLFLIPLLAIAMGFIEFIARTFGLLPDYIHVFEVPFVFLIVGIILIFGIPVFWLANRLMQVLEKIKRPTVYDHLRQSIFFYLIIIYSLFIWICCGFHGSEHDLYFLTLSSYSLISIAINYVFLFRRRKTNII